jgi:IS30 family transposase
MRQPLSNETRHAILMALAAGTRSHNAIANQYGVHQSTVSRIAKNNGLVPSVNAAPNKALEAKARWDTERRHRLLDKGFDKMESMLPAIEKPGELRDWMVSLGISIDKVRLESDLSTQNIEQHVYLTIEQAQAIRELLLNS